MTPPQSISSPTVVKQDERLIAAFDSSSTSVGRAEQVWLNPDCSRFSANRMCLPAFSLSSWRRRTRFVRSESVADERERLRQIFERAPGLHGDVAQP
jgi:hypothetical protein